MRVKLGLRVMYPARQHAYLRSVLDIAYRQLPESAPAPLRNFGKLRWTHVRYQVDAKQYSPKADQLGSPAILRLLVCMTEPM